MVTQTQKRISGDVMQRIHAALESVGNSSSCTMSHKGIKLELEGTNSPYISHQKAWYGYSDTLDGRVLYASNCRKNRLLLVPPNYLDAQKAEGYLKPDDTEEVITGIVPKTFAEALLSRAYKHLHFTGFSTQELVEVWVIRKRLARWTDTGKPIYVGEEPVEVEEEIEV